METCQYIPYLHPREDRPLSLHSRPGALRHRPPANDLTLQGRLRHLEHLVSVLKSQKREAGGDTQAGSGDGPLHPADDPNLPPRPSTSDPRYSTAVDTAGSLVGNSRYVDSANWEAILEDVGTHRPSLCGTYLGWHEADKMTFSLDHNTYC